MRKIKHYVVFTTVALIMLLYCQLACAHEERTDGYFTLFSPEGDVIFQTAIVVDLGDEFIAQDNSHYRVFSIDGDRANCQYLGKSTPAKDISQRTWGGLPPFSNFLSEPVLSQNKPSIAIYHTHSDESYVPTDGTASIYGKGGIFKVGSAFSQALRTLSFNVIHDTTVHDPHDAMSYTRSRRTATELLRRKPVALFDVHRDAVPRDLYVANVKGQDVTKLTLVVGRENPKIQANLDFAKHLKELNDKQNPGLIKGIFLAKGGYNQDLFDKALLIEVGTHENDRTEAEKGISLFADSIPKINGIQDRLDGRTQLNRVSWSAVGRILFLVIIGGSAYLYLSTGSFKELRDKVNRFVRTEFKEFTRRKRLK